MHTFRSLTDLPARALMRSVWMCVLALVWCVLSGCVSEKPLSPAMEDFLAEKPYATADYSTTIITVLGDTVTAPALHERFYIKDDQTFLSLQIEPRRILGPAEIHAMTFATGMRVDTRDGRTLRADGGSWWFEMQNGRVHTWTARLVSGEMESVVLSDVDRIMMEHEGPLQSWLLFGLGAGIGLGALMLIASTNQITQ